MSDAKKYYYLKVKDTFFDTEEMKILESQKNGIEYQNLYLKMCLLSLKAGGKLVFKDSIPYDCQMLSTVLRVNIDTVKTGIELFEKLKLVKITETESIFMSDIQTLIGSSSSEGDRVKQYRARIKKENKCSTKSVRTYANRTPEIELKIEKELDIKDRVEKPQKHKYGEYQHILLTDSEKEKLIEAWGKAEFDRMLKTMDEGIETHGYKYKSHYLALKKWKENENGRSAGREPLKVNTRTAILDMGE